jgi:hypothetical protein
VGLEQLGDTAESRPAAGGTMIWLLRAADPVRRVLPQHHLGIREELPRGADLSRPGHHHSDDAADVRGTLGLQAKTR